MTHSSDDAAPRDPVDGHSWDELSLFQGLPTAVIDDLLQHGRHRVIPRGAALFMEGDTSTSLFVLLRGRVMMSRRQRSVDKDDLYVILGPGEVFGNLAFFDPLPRMASARATTSVEVLEFDNEEMQRWLRVHHEAALTMLTVLVRRLLGVLNAMESLFAPDVPARVARFVVDHAEQFGRQTLLGLQVPLDLSQEEVARLVGASRERVNRALSDFEARGWLRRETGEVIVLDHEALLRRAGRHGVVDYRPYSRPERGLGRD